MLLLLLLLGAFAFTVYVVYQFFLHRREQREQANSVEGQIEQWVHRCEEHLARYEREITDIQRGIDELEGRFKATSDPAPEAQAETERILEGLRKEIELRHAKQRFFSECQERLNTLLQNHRLQEELNHRRKQLEHLRDQQHDDIAEMEQLRWSLEQQSTYLESIADLSRRAVSTESVDHTEHLVRELEGMRP